MKKLLKNELFFAEAERLLADGQSVTLLVRGNSMRPLLRDGIDRVTIRRHRPDEIEKGAVMFFRYKGAYVMHRIKTVTGDEVVFAGDGNYRTVEHARRGDIIAKVVVITRTDGRKIECSGRRWRIMSAAWLTLPPIARRGILGISRRINKR